MFVLRFLQAQEDAKQVEAGREFRGALEGLVGLLERGEREILGGVAKEGGVGVVGEGELAMLRKGLGLWVEGADELGWVDVMAGPCTSFELCLHSPRLGKGSSL